MRHARVTLHRLTVDDTTLAVVQGTVVVVERDGTQPADWEVVAHLGPPGAADGLLARGRCDIEMTVITGAEADGTPRRATWDGPAAVVRVVDDVVVLRGDGPLEGVDADLLDGDPADARPTDQH